MTEADIDPRDVSLAEWLARLAQPSGAPGGGSAAAVMASIAAGLLSMVAAYTPDDVRAAEAVVRLGRRRQEAIAAGEEDGIRSAAFGGALASGAGPDRDDAITRAAAEAAFSSIAVGRCAGALMPEAVLLAEIGNPSVRSDLLVAVAALRAALEGSIITAKATLKVLGRHRRRGDEADTMAADLNGRLRQLERRHSALTTYVWPAL